MREPKQLTVGVIGMGKMGLLHASILNTIPGVRVSRILEKSRKVTWFAKKALGDIHVTDSFDKFARSTYDAIYITTPIPTHFAIVKELYSMRITKNIFVEKTLTSNYEQSAILCREAKTTGGVTMVGYMSRFAPTFKKTRELLLDDMIGNLTSFKAYAYASDFAGLKGKSLGSKGGATRDLGAHIIDLSLWFFGELEVELATPAISIAENSENGSRFGVSNSSGLRGDFEISWAKAGYRLPEFGLVISGSKGVITVNADLVKLENSEGGITSWHRQDFNDNVPFLLGAPEYYREDEHFIKAISEGRSAEPDFFTASKVDLLIDRAESRMDVSNA